METLTKQQKAFVAEYIKCLDAKEAAIKAGYQKSHAKIQGEALIKKEAVLKELNRLLNKQVETLQVGKAYIVKRLLNIIEFSLEEEQITDKEGNSTGKTKLKDTQSCLRALDCLCKHLGLASSGAETLENEPKITIIDNLNERKI